MWAVLFAGFADCPQHCRDGDGPPGGPCDERTQRPRAAFGVGVGKASDGMQLLLAGSQTDGYGRIGGGQKLSEPAALDD